MGPEPADGPGLCHPDGAGSAPQDLARRLGGETADDPELEDLTVVGVQGGESGADVAQLLAAHDVVQRTRHPVIDRNGLRLRAGGAMGLENHVAEDAVQPGIHAPSK